MAVLKTQHGYARGSICIVEGFLFILIFLFLTGCCNVEFFWFWGNGADQLNSCDGTGACNRAPNE